MPPGSSGVAVWFFKMPDIKLAAFGNLQKDLNAQRKDVAAGIRAGTEDAAVFGKTRFRDMVTGAGLGNRLAKSWRHNVYPDRRKETFEPAALIFSKAPELMNAFNEGGLITPRRGAFLAIPTEFAPKSRHPLARHRNMPLKEFREVFGDGVLSLREKKGSGGQVLYAFAEQGFRRRFGKRRGVSRVKKGGRIKSEPVLMYVLVKQTRLQRRLNIDAVGNSVQQVYPSMVIRSILKRLGQ